MSPIGCRDARSQLCGRASGTRTRPMSARPGRSARPIAIGAHAAPVEDRLRPDGLGLDALVPPPERGKVRLAADRFVADAAQVVAEVVHRALTTAASPRRSPA